MKENNRVMQLFSVIYYLVGITLISARFLQSPCPDVFSYQWDTIKGQYFGRIEVDDIGTENIARLNVDLSIGMELPPKLVGAIALVKSRQATIEDIIHGRSAQYRVTFPLPNILPTVLSIALNDRIICRGYRAMGRVSTTINLEHTLYTQLHSQKLSQISKNLPVEEPEFDLIRKFQGPSFPQSAANMLLKPATERTSVSPPTLSTKSTCGRHSSAFLKRYTLNGELVDKGQFPWNVPLFDRTQRRNPKYLCGSTIITKKHLITAAHCVYEIDDFMKPERLLAVPGMYNIDNFFEENAQLAYVETVIPHDQYEHEDDLNDADMAVLRLRKELAFDDYVVPICPWQGENDLSSIVGQKGYLAGWGVTERGVTAVPTYIKTTIVSRRQCNMNLNRVYPYNARIFCGDGRGSTPCNGDSGSGLVLKRGNQYYLRGIVSRGLVDPRTLKCDVTKYAVYTDIALFRFWLKSVVG